MERGEGRERKGGRAEPPRLGSGAQMSEQINGPRFSNSLEATEHVFYYGILIHFS